MKSAKKDRWVVCKYVNGYYLKPYATYYSYYVAVAEAAWAEENGYGRFAVVKAEDLQRHIGG